MDVIALYAMGFRSDAHPFIEAICMASCPHPGLRIARPPVLPGVFCRKVQNKFANDIELLRETAEEVIESRKTEAKAEARELEDRRHREQLAHGDAKGR
ncbi:hypothetical protein PpBr36_03850 [Pyricularia pennisetigena]|uniref:hypothetical protein n=1 Tax=Pyricularia pennisetigena TaxID=1578925 RepID=UPI001150DF8D|nr:hypothetical protein PpBr36_03850 [Pyricularia pennisetigena]TLS30958.1 hypothetical protein PpBr36_03850 [Pyricularia pennisetigena]